MLRLIRKVKKEKAIFICFALLVFAFYGNSLLNGFVLDDRMVVEENIYIHSPRYFYKIFSGCIWEYALGSCKNTTLHYRPFHSLSYLLTYQISESPWFFHLVNLGYYFLVCWLIFVLVKKITSNILLAFLSGLFFLIHPINSEVVNWISAVSDSLVAIFSLLSISKFIDYRNNQTKKDFFLATLFYLFAMFSKETSAICLPLIILSLDLIFFKRKPKDCFKEYLIFIVPFVFYFLLRILVLGSFGGLSQHGTYLGSFSLKDRIYYFFWLFFKYLKTLLFPYPLLFYHGLEKTVGFLSAKFLFLCAVFLGFVFLFKHFLKKNNKFLIFSLVWIVVFLIPMLVFYNIAGDNIFAERYLFSPVIGFSLLAAWFMNSLLKSNRKIGIVIIITVVAVSWFVIFERNKSWNSEIGFFQENLRLNPAALPLREYLADSFKRAGDLESAKTQYEEIIKRDPHWKFVSHAFNNLGDYYLQKQNYQKAEEYFKQAISEADKINDYKSYNNLGALYIQEGRYFESLSLFCHASVLNPEALEPVSNFNYVASIIENTKEENPVFVYSELVGGGVFEEKEGGVILLGKQCLYGNCLYRFKLIGEENELFLPFLTTAIGFPNELLTITGTELDEQTRDVFLTINDNSENKSKKFIFPTCSGIYYSVVVD